MAKLNINPGQGYTPIIPASQYDVGRELEFVIYDGNTPASIPSGTNATMVGTKPSGLGFTENCSVYGNTVTVLTTATMTEEGGHIPAELRLTYNGKNIGTANFIFGVEPSPHPDDVIDGDTETAKDLMTRAEEAVTEAETAAESAAAAATRAEEAAAGAGLDATGAGANQVPTANGSGGWSWQDQQGGGGGGGSTSDDITNESTVSGETVTDALETLSGEIANEATARQSAVSGVQSSLSSEATTRADADASLRSAIDALVSPSGQSVVVDSSLSISGAAADAKVTGDKIAELKNDLDDAKTAIAETLSDITWTDGYISYPNGTITASSNYQYSSPIDISCGRIAVTLTDDTSVAVIARYDDVSNRYIPLLAGDGTAQHKQYIYDVVTPGKYVISYRKPNGIGDISVIATYDNVSNLYDTLNSRTIYSESVQFASVEGSYLNANVEYKNSALYAHTSPLFLLAGVYKITAYASNNICVAASCDQFGSNRAGVIITDGTVGHFSLNVATAGYYIFSYRIAEGLVISKQYNVKDQIALVDGKLNDNALVALNRYKSDLITPNFSIKAFKTLNYIDGTTDKYAYVLWNDEVNDTFYMSDGIYSEKHKIFDWNSVIAGNYDSSYYQALILPNGDILFVFQTQFINPSDATAEGSYRRNPLICRASNGFRLEVIDFGNGVKPTGWLQNVGAIYSYAHDRVFIAEYTRANEKYARIWAVDMPVTTVSNWHIVLEKEIPTPYQTGFKHFHSCQQDPYTGILYFSSGDNDLSSAVWYSTDGGDTLVQLDSYDAGKYRMLNMAFTKEYVYWASDQWSPNHFLWRIERDENTGVLDVTTLTKLLTFDDERVDGVSRIATYTTVYMSAYNCLMMLDRDDGANHPKIPVRVYDIPSGNLYTVAELLPITSGAAAGFRNVAVTCYTKSNEVACSFDKHLLNNNRMLGNNSTNRINNLVMRLYKSGDAIQKVVTPSSWTDGYITNNGAIASSDRYKYSSPFDVEEGRISVELTDDSNVAVFSSYDEQSGTYTPLVFGVGTGVHKVYEYNVTNPGKYVISYRTPNGIGDIKVITKDASYRVDFDTVY